MSALEQALIFTIDGKKNRLRIAKSTMKVLEDPVMVQLLYNPDRREIVVRAANEQTPGGQEVYIHQSKPGGDYEMYSMSLVQKMRDSNPDMLERCTYRIYGEAFRKERLVVFHLSSMERVVND